MNKNKTNLAVNGTTDRVLPGIATRVGGSDKPWTGNWVQSGHTLQTKWGG